MRNFFLAACCVAAPLAFASDLELQEGQWMIYVQSTDLSLGANSDGYTDSLSSTEGTQSNAYLDFGLSGAYKINERTKLGSYIYLYRDSDVSTTEVSGTTTEETTTVDFRYQLSPFVEYQLTETLYAYGEWSYYFDNGNEITELGGATSYASDDYSSRNLYVGLIYRQDIRPDLMLEAEGYLGLGRVHYEDPENSNDNSDTYYQRLVGNLGGRYFLANNFSINAGLTVRAGRLSGYEIDGDEVDLSDYDWSYMNFGTTFGFSYYHR